MRIIRNFFLIIFLFFYSALNYADDPQIRWGYSGNKGPQAWGKLSPNYILCATGKKQSPININQHEPTEKNNLKIDYQPAPLYIMDNGLTNLTINDHKLSVNLGRTLQINFPKTQETIQFGKLSYRLTQFHFHTPAENHIKDRVFPAEIHFVHQGRHGEILVVAVFIKAGKKNIVLQRILNNVPKTKGKVFLKKQIHINPEQLLPMNKSYFSFLGSLTTPPCTENVRWIVLFHPIEASNQQLNLLKNAVGKKNARPIQLLGNRKIVFVSIEH